MKIILRYLSQRFSLQYTQGNLWVFVPSFQFNMSHHINHLSFGIDYPGIVNPLDGMREPALKCKFCNKIVHTVYISGAKQEHSRYQF